MSFIRELKTKERCIVAIEKKKMEESVAVVAVVGIFQFVVIFLASVRRNKSGRCAKRNAACIRG